MEHDLTSVLFVAAFVGCAGFLLKLAGAVGRSEEARDVGDIIESVSFLIVLVIVFVKLVRLLLFSSGGI